MVCGLRGCSGICVANNNRREAYALIQEQRLRAEAGLVLVRQLAKGHAGAIEQSFPADLLAPALKPLAVDGCGLVVVKRIIDAALFEPGARLVHGLAVFDALDRCIFRHAASQSATSLGPKLPPPTNVMLCAPDQTVHEYKFSDSPANRTNRLFVEMAAVVQQRDVRRKTRTLAEPQLLHFRPQRLMKHHQPIDPVSSTQNQRVAARKAFYAIKRDVKRRDAYGRACFHSFVNNASRQPVIIADPLNRDMKSFC
jgi:hypothetical protein